jgi:tol-pal system protein YbgF
MIRAALRPALAFAAMLAIVVPGSMPARAQMSAADLLVRIDQLEHQIRQLTGTVEQLQYRNQQLENQLRRMQEDSDFRLQELGAKGGAPRPAGAPVPAAQSAQPLPPPAVLPPAVPPPASPSRRSDAFDPNQNPGAPGAPRPLGSIHSHSEAQPAPRQEALAMPGSRGGGAPLDLSTPSIASAGDPNRLNGALLPPPPPRNPSATGALATLPPSQTPRDEYDLAYGYVLRKDYKLAEESFRAFLNKYPSDRLAIDAHYWLGESLFQRQKHREAADAFLAVSKKYENSAKAPDALLRLGQSLAALNEKELACATLGEIGRKYPRVSPTVKQMVEREQKRVRC